MTKSNDTNRQFLEAFSLFDKDHDNIISSQDLGSSRKNQIELKSRKNSVFSFFSGVVLRSCGLSPSESELEKIRQEVGKKIDFDTFVKVAENFRSNHRENEEEIREALRVFDKDGTNLINVAELKHAMISLGERLNEEEIDELIREADIDADGRFPLCPEKNPKSFFFASLF